MLVQRVVNFTLTYKRLFPDWQSREKLLVERIQKDCGSPCNNETPMSEEDVQAAKAKGNQAILDKLGL